MIFFFFFPNSVPYMYGIFIYVCLYVFRYMYLKMADINAPNLFKFTLVHRLIMYW